MVVGKGVGKAESQSHNLNGKIGGPACPTKKIYFLEAYDETQLHSKFVHSNPVSKVETPPPKEKNERENQ